MSANGGCTVRVKHNVAHLPCRLDALPEQLIVSHSLLQVAWPLQVIVHLPKPLHLSQTQQSCRRNRDNLRLTCLGVLHQPQRTVLNDPICLMESS